MGSSIPSVTEPAEQTITRTYEVVDWAAPMSGYNPSKYIVKEVGSDTHHAIKDADLFRILPASFGKARAPIDLT